LPGKIVIRNLPLSVYEDNKSTRLEYFNDEKKVQITNDLINNPELKRIKDIANRLIEKKPSEFKAIGFNFNVVKEFDSLEAFPLVKKFNDKINEELAETLDTFDFRFKITNETCEKVFTINRVTIKNNEIENDKVAYSFTANYNFDDFKDAEDPLEIKEFVSNNIINKMDEYYKNFEEEINRLQSGEKK
jgi:hypothetical protein